VLPAAGPLGRSPAAALRQRARVDRFARQALQGIHAPTDRQQAQGQPAPLGSIELLLLQLNLRNGASNRSAGPTSPWCCQRAREGLVAGPFLDLLPFPLNIRAQQRVLAGDSASDPVRSSAMARLAQGDVGSGKTVVAIAALLTASEAGCQGALGGLPRGCWPEQHAGKLGEWLAPVHIKHRPATGSTPRPRRQGTAAGSGQRSVELLAEPTPCSKDPVQFARLGWLVGDEQHRLRPCASATRLLGKGPPAHLLTSDGHRFRAPWPSPCMAILEVSQIDELPPDRTPVCTQTCCGEVNASSLPA